jgi:hypothetical protein
MQISQDRESRWPCSQVRIMSPIVVLQVSRRRIPGGRPFSLLPMLRTTEIDPKRTTATIIESTCMFICRYRVGSLAEENNYRATGADLTGRHIFISKGYTTYRIRDPPPSTRVSGTDAYDTTQTPGHLSEGFSPLVGSGHARCNVDRRAGSGGISGGLRPDT